MRRELIKIIEEIEKVVLGKRKQIVLALACLFAKGHLLIEDIPGIGKTTLAQGLARTLGLEFRRIQFTSDLLPGDVLGAAVFNRTSNAFDFHKGPIFTQVLLADEINRATPKTQSALLEAMEERQVTVEGKTRPLPHPFFVMATQNPIEQSGVYPLPDSQLDRFLIRIDLGYPARDSEMALLEGGDAKVRLKDLRPMVSGEKIGVVQEIAIKTHASKQLMDYVLDLVGFTRDSGQFHTGLSPRAGLGLLNCARSWAFIHGRAHVLPEDVQAVMVPVVRHRLRSKTDQREFSSSALKKLLLRVPIP